MKSALLICSLAIICVVYADNDDSDSTVSTTTEPFNYESQKKLIYFNVSNSLNALSQLYQEKVVNLGVKVNDTLKKSFLSVQGILNLTLSDVRNNVKNANDDSFDADVCYQNASDSVASQIAKSTEDLEICSSNALQEIESFAELIATTRTFGENVLIKLNTISKLCNDPNKEENDNCLSNEMQDFPLSSYTILVEMLKSFKLPVVSGALHPRDGCLADIVLESREGALDIQLEAELCVQKQITKATS
ncbi:hypothetical protein KM043_018782 [Ampulex compressa]|uniref:Venom protein n=1 Tax=Ampulex compressa TaxID=860918 RepID=A0A1W6EWA1_AMPCP|nr:venom protein [Ampulex compressa]KAG7196758.1 hypothetical protein KM043_018782 [Ampulex compressa]